MKGELALLLKARALAAHEHRDQRRKDASGAEVRRLEAAFDAAYGMRK